MLFKYQPRLLHTSKSMGWCDTASNDPTWVFHEFLMEVLHCIFTSFHAVLICNRISQRAFHSFRITLDADDFMDIFDGIFIIRHYIQNIKNTSIREQIIVDLPKIADVLPLNFCTTLSLVLCSFSIASIWKRVLLVWKTFFTIWY